ncbi:flagellar hook-basal body complex protein FliE [uncultured Umboniibacter sp.]|uniref:flagellar hook-basal body complex protein FliE n=1 Tax=uncultured Umboniibacter sp. TaxID=1798917 RepID=UPI002624086F|nr:flagellar hook-basal body complex protein FliE [uncultured Umboniibacter sp.]
MSMGPINADLASANLRKLSVLAPSKTDFPDIAQAVKDSLMEANQRQNMASEARRAVELGDSDDLVGAMVASQKASITFDVMLSVRNKVLTAYQDLIKMPL